MKDEELEKSLARVHEWIRSVDQKISIALVLEAGVLVILMKPTYTFFMRLHPSPGVLVVVLLVATMVLFGAAMLKAVIALAPRLRPPKSTKSVLYFGSIATMELKAFSRKVKRAKKDDYATDLIQQIHVSSVISQRKHQALADSLYLMLAALIPWLVALVIMWARIYAN